MSEGQSARLDSGNSGVSNVPRVVRPMRVDPDNLPTVGTRSKCLGVREPPDPHADVDIDGAGDVLLNRKGLSVTADWKQLPGHLIPEHLDDGFNGASGRGLRVFVHGAGAFQEGPLATRLELIYKAGKTDTGLIVPTTLESLKQFQQNLAATRSDWSIDES